MDVVPHSSSFSWTASEVGVAFKFSILPVISVLPAA